jgi:acyl-CoA thioester hydrolase
MTQKKLYCYFHFTPIQIRFNDIDKLGHATNSVYQQYLDLGRMNYFREVLEEDMDWEVEGLILASVNIEFIKPIEMYDRLIAKSKIYHLGNKSVKMCQELFNETKGEISATSKSTMVGYSNKTKSTLIVPERWRKRIIAYEKDVLFEV